MLGALYGHEKNNREIYIRIYTPTGSPYSIIQLRERDVADETNQSEKNPQFPRDRKPGSPES